MKRILRWSFVASYFLAGFRVGSLHAEDGRSDVVRRITKPDLPIVEFTAWIEAYSPDRRLDAYSRSKTTVDLNGSDLLKLQRIPEGISAVDRPGAHYEYHNEIIYNGEVWVSKISKRGWSGDTFRTKEATISNREPGWTVGKPYLTGLCYFPQYLEVLTRDSQPLYKLLQEKPGGIFKVSNELLENEPCILLDFSTKFNIEKIYLSVERNLALRRHEIRLNYNSIDLEKLDILTDVTECQKIAPAVFIPKTASLRVTKNGKADWLYTFNLESAEVTGLKNMSEIVSKIDIPPGWRVDDERFNVKFTVGDDPEVVIDEFRKERQKHDVK